MPRVKLFEEQEVLIRAMDLFWKQGYSATSIRDLVNHLGINRASLYNTFGDKEQLFKKSFELYRTENKVRVIQFLENRPNVKAGFSELFKNAIKDAIIDLDKKGCFVVNTTTELIPNDERLLEILELYKRDIEAIFYNYLKRGKEMGQLKTNQDLKALASLFFTLYNGLMVVSKVRPDEKELSDTVNITMSLLY